LVIVGLICFLCKSKPPSPKPAAPQTNEPIPSKNGRQLGPQGVHILDAPAPASVDLTSHNGALIDFSTGRAVIKDSQADKDATAKAVAEMEEAAKEVTFEPVTTGQAAKPTADATKK
jgi:hypothetical protein